MAGDDRTVLSFEAFELDLDRFELRRSGVQVPLERQTFDVLTFLVTRAGQVVTKEQLLDGVWQSRFVSESALTTQIKAARKALDDDGRNQRLIRTVHGRGYEFVGDALPNATAATPGPPPTSVRARPGLIGREGVLQEALDLLAEHQVVTLVGPGGIGKTRLARELLDVMGPTRPDGGVFVDLASIPVGGDPALAVAEAVGLDPRMTGVAIADQLAAAESLIVLDNCEHVIGAVADLVGRLAARPSDPVRVLATSREALDIEPEQVLVLSTLATTAEHPGPSAAARLFLERSGLAVDDDARAEVEALVHQLDGLPLAIELAAAQLSYMTLGELRERVEAAPELLTTSARRRGERQVSLERSVEWSWNLLDGDERTVLAQLSVFRGPWGLGAADGVLRPPSAGSALPVLGRLVAKSLVDATPDGRGGTRYRLQFGIRQFASRRLVGEDAADAVERHAAWFVDTLGAWSFEEQWSSFDYLRGLLADLDDVRAATEQAIAAGDMATAARLVAAATPSYRYGIGSRLACAWAASIDRARLPADLAGRLLLAEAEARYALGEVATTHSVAEQAFALTGAEPDSGPAIASLIEQCIGRGLTEPERCRPLLDDAIERSRAHGLPTFEAIALGLLGFIDLGAARDLDRAAATADTADRLASPGGWDRYFVATLRGAALVEGDRPVEAAAQFDLLCDLADAAGLRAARAVFGLLAAMGVGAAGDDSRLREAITNFRREYSRSTGHAGRANVLLALGYRAAMRGESTTAAQALEAVAGHRLAHQVIWIVARRTAELCGLPPSFSGATARPGPDAHLEPMIEALLAEVD